MGGATACAIDRVETDKAAATAAPDKVRCILVSMLRRSAGAGNAADGRRLCDVFVTTSERWAVLEPQIANTTPVTRQVAEGVQAVEMVNRQVGNRLR